MLRSGQWKGKVGMEKAKVGVIVHVSNMLQRYASYQFRHMTWLHHMLVVANSVRSGAPIYLTRECPEMAGIPKCVDDVTLSGLCGQFAHACAVGYDLVVDQDLDYIVVWNAGYPLVSVDALLGGIHAVEGGGCVRSACRVQSVMIGNSYFGDGFEVVDAFFVCASKNEYAQSPYVEISRLQGKEVKSLEDLRIVSTMLGVV